MTNLPSDIRTAWDTYVWQHATVQSYTTKIYQYDVVNITQRNLADLLFNGEINFITAINVREPVEQQVNKILFGHEVLVSYYMEAKPGLNRGDNYQAVIDRLTAIEDIARNGTDFGSDWNNTVDFWQVAEVRPPTAVQIAEKPVWLGSYLYVGTKLINC